jgi:hypothetical protein
MLMMLHLTKVIKSLLVPPTAVGPQWIWLCLLLLAVQLAHSNLQWGVTADTWCHHHQQQQCPCHLLKLSSPAAHHQLGPLSHPQLLLQHHYLHHLQLAVLQLQ